MSLGYASQFENELRKLLDERIADLTETMITVGSAASADFHAYQRGLGGIAALRGVRDVLLDEASKRLQER